MTSEDGNKSLLATAIRNFTNDFHKDVAGKTEGNFVSSALSAHLVLAMAAYGADGITAEQMRKTLHLPDNDEHAHQEFHGFIESVNNVTKVILKIANKVCIADRISIKDTYKDIISKHFHSEHSIFDFTKAAESAKIINDWCIEKTNGKIKDLLSADDMTADTAMILLNAVYFKGNWKDKFNDQLTKPKPFHVDEKTTIEVPTMHIKRKFQYKELPELDAVCVSLPYENEDLSMQIVVPNKIDGLKLIEQNLEKIDNERFYTQEVNLALPKFKIETTIDLNEHLQALGMTEMFGNSASFKNATDAIVKVSKVKQKAFIEVNEEGSEAAAVTGIVMVACCLPPPAVDLNIDRPFLYKITHKNVTLFAGRVANPL